MNNKSQFTPEGVDERIKRLYEQPTPVIEREAVAVETDFNAWLENNFILDASQVEYLESLGTVFSNATGQSLATAFRNKTRVTMEKGEIQLRSVKFVREEVVNTTTYAPNANPLTEEILNYFIS